MISDSLAQVMDVDGGVGGGGGECVTGADGVSVRISKNLSEMDDNLSGGSGGSGRSGSGAGRGLDGSGGDAGGSGGAGGSGRRSVGGGGAGEKQGT